MTYSFLELLIFLLINSSRYLVFFSHHAKKIFYVDEYKLHGKPIKRYKQTFSFVSDIDVEKIGFLCKVNSLYE